MCSTLESWNLEKLVEWRGAARSGEERRGAAKSGVLRSWEVIKIEGWTGTSVTAPQSLIQEQNHPAQCLLPS